MRTCSLGLLVIALVGCGPREPIPVGVSGMVKLDSKLLAEGKISFVTPGRAPEILDVVNGKFEGKVLPGVAALDEA